MVIEKPSISEQKVDKSDGHLEALVNIADSERDTHPNIPLLPEVAACCDPTKTLIEHIDNLCSDLHLPERESMKLFDNIFQKSSLPEFSDNDNDTQLLLEIQQYNHFRDDVLSSGMELFFDAAQKQRNMINQFSESTKLFLKPGENPIREELVHAFRSSLTMFGYMENIYKKMPDLSFVRDIESLHKYNGGVHKAIEGYDRNKSKIDEYSRRLDEGVRCYHMHYDQYRSLTGNLRHANGNRKLLDEVIPEAVAPYFNGRGNGHHVTLNQEENLPQVYVHPETVKGPFQGILDYILGQPSAEPMEIVVSSKNTDGNGGKPKDGESGVFSLMIHLPKVISEGAVDAICSKNIFNCSPLIVTLLEARKVASFYGGSTDFRTNGTYQQFRMDFSTQKY